MKAPLSSDVAVVGGGLVGLGTALALSRDPSLKIAVLEAEETLAAHQSGHNSGVIHSGIYYAPGSLKAHLCVSGREALVRFCEEEGVPYRPSGKIIAAVKKEQEPVLLELLERGRRNGLKGARLIPGDAVRECEPHVRCLQGLHVPETGVVDFAEVALAMAQRLAARGTRILTKARLLKVRDDGDRLRLITSLDEVSCRYLINCAGLHSDRVARLCGLRPEVRIIPFRGEWLEIVPARRHLVRSLIYPVPDPRLPFLGVHLTRNVHDQVHAGPNAVLALRREGYSRWSFSFRDAAEILLAPRFWRLAARHWKTGVRECLRSLSRRSFAGAAAELIPEIRSRDLVRDGAGVRAQAVDPSGRLVDDFRIMETKNQVHVLNAPSPAATACLAIGEAVATRVRKQLGGTT